MYGYSYPVAGKSDAGGTEILVPGPTIRAKVHEPITVFMQNQLPPVHPQFGTVLHTSTHLHGSPSLPQYDGYASDVTGNGFVKRYEYPNVGPARTLWYHDHGVSVTAQNAYSGLAAQYHLHDEYETSLLPQGDFDLAFTLSDAMFDAGGKLAFDDHSHSGLWGDVILVNGVPWPFLEVEPKAYRFRFLNASISRSYRPQLVLGNVPQPVLVVATDAGLMARPAQVNSWRHGNAERYEVVIDFSKYAGRTLELRNLSNPNNIDYDNTNKIAQFRVTKPPTSSPSQVPTMAQWDAALAKMRADGIFTANDLPDNPANLRTVQLRFERQNGMWTINGETWEKVIESNFTRLIHPNANPAVGETQVWEIVNGSGGWFHPVHIHLVDFKILSRNGGPPFAFERGPKDTVYVGENETVRVVAKFDAPGGAQGRWMIHCHNLPHEDHDMMGQFAVGDGAQNDPISSDPPSRIGQ